VKRLTVLLLLALPVLAAAAPPKAADFPKTPLGAHASAFVAAFNAKSDAMMKEMYQEHYSPTALDRIPIADRLEFTRGARMEQAPLRPHKFREQSATKIVMVAEAATGDWLQLTFEAEEGDAASRLRGVQIEPSEPPMDAPAPPPMSAQQLADSAEVMMNTLAASDRFSGSVLVARGDRVLYERAVGLADRRWNVPNTVDTRFNLGSINKMFTRVAIAKLIEGGQLSPNDALGTHVPGLPPALSHQITVDQLVHFTAGTGDFFGPEFDRTNPDRIRTTRDYLPFFVNKPLEFPPGTNRKYSNAGYILLGLLIERITGMSYYDFVQQTVLDPAGMKDSGYFLSDSIVPRVAMGYTREHAGQDPTPMTPLRENIFSRPGRGSSAGGGYATARDLHRFARALMTEKLVSKKILPWVTGDDGVGGASGSKPRPVGMGFAGGAPGISARLESPDGDLVVVVLANQDPQSVPPVADRLLRWGRRVR
jgi:CubicO group peptidase (beta-lactamase class C family)